MLLSNCLEIRAKDCDSEEESPAVIRDGDGDALCHLSESGFVLGCELPDNVADVVSVSDGEGAGQDAVHLSGGDGGW